jgi:cytosine/adenosine deaminase-related metal-dependent hydrolase
MVETPGCPFSFGQIGGTHAERDNAEIEDGHLIAKRQFVIRGARYATGPGTTSRASIQITNDRVTRIAEPSPALPESAPESADINLDGFLILPGFVNAHDHLQFALFPRMGNPPYRNYIDWGEDIHRNFPEVIAKHHAVSKADRLWWGGIRNLLCGVTTVGHHNALWPELRREDFPVRVVQDYGWAHSLALGGDIRQARAATPVGRPFIVHACEGVDEQSREELWALERLGVLDSSTVLVHGLNIDRDGVALIRSRRASLIVCPSSNEFLFGTAPDLSLLDKIGKIALGSDSPLTANGDLLDEIRFAMRFCGISAASAYRMVTTAPPEILRLENAEGSIKESGLADLVAVRDTGQFPAERVETLSLNDVELVMIAGRVQLASESMLERLPSAAKHGLEPLSIDGSVRWLRAPIKTLLHRAEEVLGIDEVRFGCRRLLVPPEEAAQHAN